MRLPIDFYLDEDVVAISKALLGKQIVTRYNNSLSAGLVVETEAYRAPDDKACHAYRNRYTERTKTMFRQGGVMYVYTSYGIHSMINVVTAEEGKAHAILIRAIEPTQGMEYMLKRRKHTKLKYDTVNGPGKTASALGVHKYHDGAILYDDDSEVWIEDVGQSVKDSEIIVGPRVGMSIHTGPDAHRPWRFYIKNNRWVSRPKIARYPHIPLG